MALPKLIIIGGSAGAIPSLLEIARGLPSHFSIPICVVIHFHPDTRSVLPMLLESASGIPAKHPQTLEFLRPRQIYVAPPDRHMVIHKNRILLHQGSLENRCRPAIDPLFRSAAAAFGAGVTAVLLSGYLDDGTAGLLAVQREGGRIIIQDPADTPYNDMPRHALEQVRADFVLPHKDIAHALLCLTESQRPRDPSSDLEESESILATEGPVDGPMLQPSLTTHASSPYERFISQNDALQNALWSALWALDEKVSLSKRLLHRAEELDQTLATSKYRKTIETNEEHIRLIRKILKKSPLMERRLSDPD